MPPSPRSPPSSLSLPAYLLARVATASGVILSTLVIALWAAVVLRNVYAVQGGVREELGLVYG